MKIYLFHLSGSNKGFTSIFELSDGEALTIGRHPDNKLALDPELDLNASGFHAEIRNEGGVFILHDIGSSFGTFHNQQPVKEIELKSRDKIRFGTEGPTVKIYIDKDLKHCPICTGPLLTRNFTCYDCRKKVCFRHFDDAYGVCEKCAAMAIALGKAPEIYRREKGIDAPAPRPAPPPAPPQIPPGKRTVVIDTSAGRPVAGAKKTVVLDTTPPLPTPPRPTAPPPAPPQPGPGHKRTVVLDRGLPTSDEESGFHRRPGQTRMLDAADIASRLSSGELPPPAQARPGRPAAGTPPAPPSAGPSTNCGMCGKRLAGPWFTCRACGKRLCLTHFYMDDVCEGCYGQGRHGVKRNRTDPEKAILRMSPGEERPMDPIATATGKTKVCPFCYETIQIRAIKCKHCGEYLDDARALIEELTDDDLPLLNFDDDLMR